MKRTIFILLSAVMLAGCARERTPSCHNNPVDTNLEISFDLNMKPPFEMTRAVENAEDATGHRMRLITEVYDVASGGLVKRVVNTYSTLQDGANTKKISIALPAAEYKFLVWGDFGSADKVIGYYHYYHTAGGLNDISIDTDRYGNTRMKDAFSGKTTAELKACEASATRVSVKLERATACYRIVAIDTDEFLARDNGVQPQKARITYTTQEQPYFRTGYSVETGFANQFLKDITYDFPVGTDADGNYVLGFDHVFPTSDGSPLFLNFEVSDGSGKRISSGLIRNIPLERNRETIIKGNFLTSSVDSGDIDIKDDFDDIIIIDI